MDNILENALLWFYSRPLFLAASPLAVTWTVVGIIGVTVSVWLLREAHADRRVVICQSNFISDGGRDIISRQNVRNLTERTGIFCVFVAIGVSAMFFSTINTHMPPSPARVILGIGLLAIEVWQTAGALRDRRDHERLLYIIRQRRAEIKSPDAPV